MRPRNLLLFIVAVLILGFGLRAYRTRCARPSEEAFVVTSSAPLWSRVAEVREVVVRAANGERLWVLERRRGWARTRTDAGQEGWIEERFLVSREVFDQFQRLEREAASRKPQAMGQIRVLANLRAQPGRNAPRLYQLHKGEPVEVLTRAAVEREPESAGREPTAETPSAPAEVRREDWYLVRCRAEPRRVGWLLARFVELNVPEEIAALAGEKRIISAIELGHVQEGDEKPAYLVALAERSEGLVSDFSAIRVFTWSQKRSRYETAYVESGLEGFWPLEVKQEDGQRVFSFERDVGGQRQLREYRMQGVVVRRVRAKTAAVTAR